MKVIFSGTPFFGKQLASKFQEYDNRNEYLYLDIKQNLFKRLYFYYHLLTTDILFITYVDAYYIKSVDFALKWKKNVIFSWIGTDVMNASPLILEKKFNQKYIQDTYHTTNSTWLQKELEEVNIKADFLTIYIYEEKKREILIPQEFSVLSYVAKGREEFYGIDTIIKLATDFKEVSFKIAGIYEYPNLPSNIQLLGWVDMEKEYPKSTVYIRYPMHDGEAHSVLEALSYGKTVLYNRNYPFSLYTPDYESLKDSLSSTINKFKNNELTPNYDAIQYIQENYNFEKTYQSYQTLFNNVKSKNFDNIR